MVRGAVAVIGGGISGLVAAYRLKELGLPVTLFEAGARPGGVIRSEPCGGYLVERGPSSFQESPGVATLIEDLGLTEELVVASAAARRRYVVRGGRPMPLPDSPGALLRTGLFSLSARLRLLAEPLAPAPDPTGEESVAEFVRRRLGREFLDYAVDPFVAGTFAGDPERLSLRHAFPRFGELERRHGSLFRAYATARRARRQQGDGPTLAPRILSFRGGVQSLTDALTARLGVAVRLKAPVRRLQRSEAGWTVTADQDGRSWTERFDAVLSTAPLYQLASIGAASGIDVHPLSEVSYPPLAVLALGFRRSDVRHPLDGFGVLVPAVERLDVLGVAFSSTLFPGRAPEGQVLLTAFVGGARSPGLALEPAGRLLERTLSDLRRLLGVSGQPVCASQHCWERSIPQYELGYGRHKAAMERLEAQHRGLVLAGSFRRGVSLGETLASGQEAAERITGVLA